MVYAYGDGRKLKDVKKKKWRIEECRDVKACVSVGRTGTG